MHVRLSVVIAVALLSVHCFAATQYFYVGVYSECSSSGACNSDVDAVVSTITLPNPGNAFENPCATGTFTSPLGGVRVKQTGGPMTAGSFVTDNTVVDCSSNELKLKLDSGHQFVGLRYPITAYSSFPFKSYFGFDTLKSKWTLTSAPKDVYLKAWIEDSEYNVGMELKINSPYRIGNKFGIPGYSQSKSALWTPPNTKGGNPAYKTSYDLNYPAQVTTSGPGFLGVSSNQVLSTSSTTTSSTSSFGS